MRTMLKTSTNKTFNHKTTNWTDKEMYGLKFPSHTVEQRKINCRNVHCLEPAGNLGYFSIYHKDHDFRGLKEIIQKKFRKLDYHTFRIM